MKKILIPTDFSNCAKNAISIGIQLAKKANAEIIFIHLLSTPVDWKNLRKEKEKNFPEVLKKIGQVKGELTLLENLAKQQNIKATSLLVYSNKSVDEHINDYDHDFVVIGSHGTKGFKEVFGSNAEKMVRHSSRPVLVIKPNTTRLNIEHIIFASTWDEKYQNQFKKGIEIAKLLNSKVHLLFVKEPNETRIPEEIISRMNEFMADFQELAYTTTIYDSINEEGGILQYAESINADLITLLTHGKSGFVQLISPSITESLVNHSKLPVLSINISH
jgi:nucleotide-binding universal stress UspA family protein